jgi:hypothetical protein
VDSPDEDRVDIIIHATQHSNPSRLKIRPAQDSDAPAVQIKMELDMSRAEERNSEFLPACFFLRTGIRSLNLSSYPFF